MSTDEFNAQRANLIAYMKDKLRMSDWHGVSDAANDLRELEAAQRVRQGEEP